MSVAYSLETQQDIVALDESSPCTAASQIEGQTSCFRSSGSQYHGTPKRSTDAKGLAMATTRLLVGIDVELGRGWWIGGRGGVALRGLGPRNEGASSPSVLRWSLQLRATNELWTTRWFRLLGFVDGGLAQTDAKVVVYVDEDRTVPPPRVQLDQPDRQALHAYRRLGKGFVGAGLGAAFSLGQTFALRLDLSARTTFPTTGFVFVPAFAIEVRP